MGLFGKARSRSQSVSSVSSEPLLQDTGNGVSPTAVGDDLYLTHTKNGKLAFGRKKPDKLLQGFGFDILSQSFGIPSRSDYERQARTLSAVSQSSGLSIAPATPRRLDNGRQMYKYDATESPLVHRKTSSVRSSSTPAHPAMARYNSRYAPSSDQHAEYKRSLSLPRSQTFNQHRIPPPPPPPPSVVGWHSHPVMNPGIAHPPMSYYNAAYQSPYPSNYSCNNAAVFQSAQNWANSQHPRTVQHPNSLGAIPPQTTPIPILPHRQQYSQPQPAQVPHIQAIPTARLFNIPPPPPPPPQNWPQVNATVVGQGEIYRQGPNQVSNAAGAAIRTDQGIKLGKDARKKYEESVRGEEMKTHLSKRIRHVHACAGCGKKRSSRYQRAHPLNRGEIPPLNYCYDCLKNAADTDGETSDEDVAYNHRSKKDDADAAVPWSSADEGRRNVSSKYTHQRARHGPRRPKKSTRFSSLARLFSYRPTPKSYPPSPRSVSSAEESMSRASLGPESDEPDEPDTINYVGKMPIRPLRCNYEGANKTTVQQQAETPAISRNRNQNQRYANIDSRHEKYHSPLLPREAKSDNTKSESKMRALSNNEPIPGQSRTPTSRSRRQAREIDNKLSPLTGMPHEERGLPELYANNAPGVISTSPSGIKGVSEHWNHTIPNKTHKSMNQINAGNAAHRRKTRNMAPSSSVVDVIDVSNKAQCHGAQASTDEHIMVPVAANEVTNLTNPKFRPSKSQVLRNRSPEINLEQTPAPGPFPGLGNSTGRPSCKRTAEAVGKPKVAFDWYGPVTPIDAAPYSSNPHSPRVVGDTWSDYQTDMEREAEEMAERDLAFAGKLFDSLSGSLGGSATSTFPVSSLVTTSNMSIVSYKSDSDHSDGDIPTAAEAGVQKGTKAMKTTKRIEFSSEKERQEKSAKLKASVKSSTAELLGCQKGNIYNQRDDGDNDTDYSPLPIGSSLIGHTGHSEDGLLKNPLARGSVATTANDHCLRLLGQLPST
ncbi:hypothetical protein O1611_g4433 [Lasiodiplodia mahajangana]|uniref:Uncharacterized protein n=1 Tax=Lasiodiplodia mahajangana TaxID=1108764 RepID=A0ACC2JNW9_9PEZI|nr:hypothetical protein O1611_g4433 [Lasiodiplodia mahajangana]